MHVFIIFLILVVIAAAWTGLLTLGKTNTVSPEANASQAALQATSQGSSGGSSQSSSQGSSQTRGATTGNYSAPGPATSPVDTYIRFGPGEGEVITQTNRVVFEFGAILQSGITGQAYFQTKLVGLETTWKSVYSTQRTIDLPGGRATYTFLVKAVVNNVADPTPAQRTFSTEVSPAYGQVKISSVRPPDVYAHPSIIVLQSNIQNSGQIDITGWELEGHYDDFFIPQGIEDFNPITTAYNLKDILIKKGDTVYISSGPNPLGPTNWNFRSNECMGYFDSFVNSLSFLNIYNLSLKSCPRPQNFPFDLSYNCKQYITHLGTCEEPTYQGEKDYGLLGETECLNYLDANLNYGGCYRNYYRDQDFWKSQWHIYLDRADKEIMDMNTDTIYLRDRNGLLVSQYDYRQNNSFYGGGSSNYPTLDFFNSVTY